MVIALSEEDISQESRTKNKVRQLTDKEINAINAKYEKGEQRILIEMNREKLPGFVAALKKPGYMDVQPFYQRRSRWDKKKQSRLIESFLINIPIPPIILYEQDYNVYEVMDGQQRITAIRNFYENKLVLTDLELWAELEGLTYEQLPAKIKAGIDRRSISSIVLITESNSDPEEAFFLKQIAFKRLNTGGIGLSNQEVRNCLYSGKFNQLLLDLANNLIFAQAWQIPVEKPEELPNNNLYKKMEDAELILRFFALRDVDNFKGGMKNFLDYYMMKSLEFSEQHIEYLKNTFMQTIELANQIYEKKLFKPYDPQSQTWKDSAYKAYYDGVMVGFSQYLNKKDLLITRKLQIIEATKKLFIEDTRKLFTGSGRTKNDIQERIKLFSDMLSQVIAE